MNKFLVQYLHLFSKPLLIVTNPIVECKNFETYNKIINILQYGKFNKHNWKQHNRKNYQKKKMLKKKVLGY